MTQEVITFHYKLTNSDGEVLDQSFGGEPLSFLSGTGHIIEGLEKELVSSAAGEKKTVNVTAEEAYGEYDEALVQSVERGQLPEELEVGMQFAVGDESAQMVVTVTDFDDNQVTLDGNHPLAGEALTFEVEVVNKREATEEEVAHGHAHGEDGEAAHIH